MTADEFERRYAERSGITVAQLRALGRVVRPCDCGAEDCEGWQSVRPMAPEERQRLIRLEAIIRAQADRAARYPHETAAQADEAIAYQLARAQYWETRLLSVSPPDTD